jgi:hypothetical protein
MNRIDLAAIAAAAFTLLGAHGAQAQTAIGGGKNVPSFPIVISQPGSYKLMSNLNVPAGVNGIVINVKGVTIDMNGYSITGPVTCSGQLTSFTCSSPPNHAVYGVLTVFGGEGVRLHNGTIKGFGVGASLGDRAVAEDLLVTENASVGLFMGASTLVKNVRAHMNRSVGILVGDFGKVSDSVVQGADIGVKIYGGVVDGVTMRYVSKGIDASSNYAIGVRGSMIQAFQPYTGVTASMGGNLCNGINC